MTLEYILGLKAGIGRSFKEAEIALNKANALKENLLPTDTPEEANRKIGQRIQSGDYAIVQYCGEQIANVQDITLEKTVFGSLKRLNLIKSRYGDDTEAYKFFKEEQEDRSHDPSTGALTPFGYIMHQMFDYFEELPTGVERFLILADVNDMHYWNAVSGYEDVSLHLAAIGKSLVKSSRTSLKVYERTNKRIKVPRVKVPDRVVKPRYVTRTHGDAGDEFLIDLHCRQQDVIKIVKRFFDRAFQAQRDIY
jgi:hypothetical protein